MKYGILGLLCLFLTKAYCQDEAGKSPTILYPCKGNKNIQYRIPKNQNNEKEKNFYLLVDKKLAANTVINITLVLPSEQTLENPSSQYTFISEELIDGVILKETRDYRKWLKTVNGRTPYVSSLLINYIQQCRNPSYNVRDQETTPQGVGLLNNLLPAQTEDLHCGRKKIDSNALLTWSFDTKPGDWPWHAALFRVQLISKYICGGTLISKTFVLTASHCVTEQGVPIVTSSLTVGLGKFNLYSSNIGDQDIDVHKIISHKDFNPTTLVNDIALLQLKSEAAYSEYIQPACLWRDGDFAKLPNPQIYGTVVGWGINQLSQLSFTLKQIKIPKIPDIECIKSKPNFFAKALNDRNFCAGYKNGTSVCNGDSGGGYMVFIPDTPGDKSEKPQGSWHVRGITSLGLVKENVMCDPYEYSLFTDVSKFSKWIRENMDS